MTESAAGQSTWWQPFADVVPPWFSSYLTLEPTASHIRTYEAQYLPGLFQTPDYARAVIGLTHTDPAGIQRRVDLRQARQGILERAEPPEIWAVIGEDALNEPPLTPGERRAQLDRLIALTERPNITIQLAGPAELDRSFTLLSFADPGHGDIVYIEEPDDARYLAEPADVARYRDLLADRSTSRGISEQTRDILRDLRDRA